VIVIVEVLRLFIILVILIIGFAAIAYAVCPVNELSGSGFD